MTKHKNPQTNWGNNKQWLNNNRTFAKVIRSDQSEWKPSFQFKVSESHKFSSKWVKAISSVESEWKPSVLFKVSESHKFSSKWMRVIRSVQNSVQVSESHNFSPKCQKVISSVQSEWNSLRIKLRAFIHDIHFELNLWRTSEKSN